MFANVPGQVSPLAFGIRGCSAAEMPKVPKAWGLTAPVCSHLFLFISHDEAFPFEFVAINLIYNNLFNTGWSEASGSGPNQRESD